MSSKKLTPDEELEKQYNDYKAQFDEWKERNKESVGTDAYVRYVKQFEDWEKGVQRQRAAIRQKTEEETRRKAEAEKVARRRQEETEMAAQRAAEQNRLANRQRRLVAAAAASTAAAAAAERQQEPVLLHRQPSATSVLPAGSQPQSSSAITAQNESNSPLEVSSMANVMQQMMNFVRNSEKQNGAEQEAAIDRHHVHPPQQSAIATTATTVSYSSHQHVQQHSQHHQTQPSYTHPTHLVAGHTGGEPVAGAASSVAAQPGPVTVVRPQQPETQAPPQLWGTEGASYALTDPMFRRWNVRAAPPNFCVPYEPPPANVISSPYWMLVETMREKKLVLAPTFKSAPMPLSHGAVPNRPNQSSGKPPSLFSGQSMAPPPIGMPPPFRLPSHAPPPFHTPYHHMGGGARPPVFNVPPPNFRMPPPPAAAVVGPPPFYKSK